MSYQGLTGLDVANNLRKLPLYDITDLEDKERWEFFFTKMNRDKKYTCTWVEDRLLFHELGWSELILRAYKDGMSFHFHDGNIEMMVGGGVKEESRNEVKEKFNWQEGDILALIPVDDEKAEFQLIKASELNIIPQKPFSKEKEAEIITPLIEETRKTLKELRSQFDNDDFSVKTELEKQQKELMSLIKWTKEDDNTMRVEVEVE